MKLHLPMVIHMHAHFHDHWLAGLAMHVALAATSHL